ncbi:MAG: hypothetical protein HFG04_02520 [Oscillibacter sp.]|nr:hypothetical protein [Oscillibacter sp.]
MINGGMTRCVVPPFPLVKKRGGKETGKEKSYERNPSGVSLVFNPKFFGLRRRPEKLARADENTFSTARNGGMTRCVVPPFCL